MVDHTVRRAGRRSDWSAVAAVFVLVIGMTYSDDVVEFLNRGSDRQFPDLRWAILALDIALIAGTALLKWHITAQPRRLGDIARSLFRGWGVVGAALALAIHVLLLTTPGPSSGWAVADSVWLTLLTTAGFVAAMGMMLASALTGNGPKGWILPVVIGTFVAQTASALWYPVISTGSGCADSISAEFFNGMVQVLPVLLITLGLEVNYLRTTKALQEPGRRAVSVLTVLLLCTAEALAFSMLIKGHRVTCGTAAIWHEYASFVLTVHAAAISLATLAWLLLASPRGRS